MVEMVEMAVVGASAVVSAGAVWMMVAEWVAWAAVSKAVTAEAAAPVEVV